MNLILFWLDILADRYTEESRMYRVLANAETELDSEVANPLPI